MPVNEICQKRTTCRICGSHKLIPVLDLGRQCLASVFESGSPPSWSKQRYPLKLVRCAEPDGCGLVQLEHSILPEFLYRHYGYRSGINELMRRNLVGIARATENMIDLQAGDTVCDIGCNDGTLLAALSTPGIDRLGIDPAENVIQAARGKGLEVVCDFFSGNVYGKVRPGKKAKAIFTIAMFYDLDDPRGFVRDVASVLADDGVWVMEMAYLPLILKNNAFDNICHEHLEYYCLRQLEWLFEQQRLKIHKLEFNDINGGSIRLFIRKDTAGPVPEKARQSLEQVRYQETSLKLDTDHPYSIFSESVHAIRRELNHLLNTIRAEEKKIYVYGASTKGNTILQFCDINNQVIGKAVDRNPDKWSARTPATGIEIISEAQARKENPDYFLVLPWAFFDVFKKREAAFLNKGGKFILPLPAVRVVGEKNEAGDVKP